MKTIIERAKEYCDKIFFNEIEKTCAFNGYIEGATEQHKIDVDKACKAYCNICYNRQTGCEKLCNDLKVFRKAMEE